METSLLQGRFTYSEAAFDASGGQGSVYRGRETATGRVVAIKRIGVKDSMRRYLEQEIDTLRNLQAAHSPYIVQLLDVVYESGDLVAYIVMEFCGGGSLQEYLKNQVVDSVQAFTWMQHLVQALKQVWSRGILHRDIKPGNILLTERSPRATLRLCDFGISKKLPPDQRDQTDIGTKYYKAPEVTERCYSVPADIYSLGLVYLDMLHGLEDTLGRPLPPREDRLRDRQRTLQNCASEFAKTVIPMMLEKQPKDRLSQEQLYTLFRYSEREVDESRCTQHTTVSKTWDIDHSAYVCLKQYAKDAALHRDIEMSVLSKARHPGLVTLLHEFQGDIIYGNSLVLESGAGGTLERYITTHGPVHELLAKRWFRSLLEAARHVHRQGVVLRNICPATIVLTDDSLSADVKLTDFEMAAVTDASEIPYAKRAELKGSANSRYRAPEVRMRLPVCLATDVWSLGAVFYFILEGRPYSEADKSPFAHLSRRCSDLLRTMLHRHDRYHSAEACLHDPFFAWDPMQDLQRLRTQDTWKSACEQLWAYFAAKDTAKAYIQALVLREMLGKEGFAKRDRSREMLSEVLQALERNSQAWDALKVARDAVEMATLWERRMATSGKEKKRRVSLS